MDLDENTETLLAKLESQANYMRGMSLDPRVPEEIKRALRERADEVDSFVESYHSV